ncbi:hypothetical protein SLEP1_g35096 [Rubroshorea leprosula]|uniref:Transmembrane protein n=1 Tax=Rubroshorea leprosula TaxID=152421 RepID=A0AAV5KM61_9ROSI|nr:hypothetical protein SLEP1_g35096 [Rubroshorea leprosula]
MSRPQLKSICGLCMVSTLKTQVLRPLVAYSIFMYVILVPIHFMLIIFIGDDFDLD